MSSVYHMPEWPSMQVNLNRELIAYEGGKLHSYIVKKREAAFMMTTFDTLVFAVTTYIEKRINEVVLPQFRGKDTSWINPLDYVKILNANCGSLIELYSSSKPSTDGYDEKMQKHCGLTKEEQSAGFKKVLRYVITVFGKCPKAITSEKENKNF